MFGEIFIPSLNTKIQFLPYSAEFYEQSMEVMRQNFFQGETVSIGCEINKNVEAQKDLEGLCADALRKSNVSIVARDVQKDKIVGIAINVIQSKPETSNEDSYFEAFRDNCCNTESAKQLIEYMIVADSRVDLFEKFQVNSLMEIMFLVVFKEYGRNGIGYQLSKHSIEIARNLDIKLVSSLFTGRNTQAIGRKLEFEVVYEEPFSNFSFNGKTFAERNGDLSLTYHLAAKNLSK